MSFVLEKTKTSIPVAIINGGIFKDNVIYIDPEAKSKDGIKKIDLPEGSTFTPLFNLFMRDFFYTAGPSGVGKSTFVRELVIIFHEIFPDAPIYLFSKLDSDKAFDDLVKKGVICRVILDQRIVDEPIEIKDEIDEKSNTLIIFDDVDTIRDKKILEQIRFIKRDIAEIGRHYNIYTIQTSHLINGTNKEDCRVVHNELSKLVFFPQSGGFHQQSYCLTQYWGLDKKTIKKILALPSRWILLSKNYPQYILTQNMCCLLKEFE